MHMCFTSGEIPREFLHQCSSSGGGMGVNNPREFLHWCCLGCGIFNSHGPFTNDSTVKAAPMQNFIFVCTCTTPSGFASVYGFPRNFSVAANKCELYFRTNVKPTKFELYFCINVKLGPDPSQARAQAGPGPKPGLDPSRAWAQARPGPKPGPAIEA